MSKTEPEQNNTILGINKTLHKYNIIKKQILVSAIKSFHKCQKVCYKNLFDVDENCLYKCESKLNSFNLLKKNPVSKFSDFLFRYDIEKTLGNFIDKKNMDMQNVNIKRNLAVTELQVLDHVEEMRGFVRKWEEDIDKGVFGEDYNGFKI